MRYVSRRPVAFALANLAALAWTAAAVLQPAVEAIGGMPTELLRHDLPFALVLAALGSALVAWHLPAERRRAFLRRHMALYLVVPVLVFTATHLDATAGPARPQVAPDSQLVLGAIYLAALLAWALHALEGLWRVVAGLGDRRGALLLGAIVLVPYLALLPYERAVIPTASDEPHYLVIVQSLLGDHDLDLKDEYDAQVYRAYYPDTLPDRHVIHVGEAQYPIRDLGLPLLVALPFAIGERLGALALICLVGAALAAQCYRAARDLGVAHRAALLGVAAAALTHPLLTYTTQLYPELAAALVFVSAARLLRGGGIWRLAAASALVGTLPWLSTRASVVAVGAGLVVAYCALRPPAALALRDRVLRVCAGALPFAALVLALSYVNWRMFGLFMPSAGYFLIRDQQDVLVFQPQVGIAGLLFDRVFGLIPRAPLYLVAALGAVPLVRRAWGAELAALLLGWLAYFLYIADIAYWSADGGPPSRYLVAGLPFLVVLLAAGVERLAGLRAGAARGIAWALGACSLFVAFAYAVKPGIRYDLVANIRASGSEGSLFAFLGRVVRPDPALLFPSLIEIGARDAALALLWTALLAALVALPLIQASNARSEP